MQSFSKYLHLATKPFTLLCAYTAAGVQFISTQTLNHILLIKDYKLNHILLIRDIKNHLSPISCTFNYGTPF